VTTVIRTIGTREYLGGDGPRMAAASHAVMKKLALVHGRKVYLDVSIAAVLDHFNVLCDL